MRGINVQCEGSFVAIKMQNKRLYRVLLDKKVNSPGQLSIINLLSVVAGPSAMTDTAALVTRLWLCPMSRECSKVQTEHMRMMAESSHAGVLFAQWRTGSLLMLDVVADDLSKQIGGEVLAVVQTKNREICGLQNDWNYGIVVNERRR
jgi:hypothetical protein